MHPFWTSHSMSDRSMISPPSPSQRKAFIAATTTTTTTTTILLWICYTFHLSLALRPAEIHRTIAELQRGPLACHPSYKVTTHQVLEVLSEWATNEIILDHWKSLTNKANLRQEVEESIVALHHLQEWQHTAQVESYLALDVCCGKGLFGILLSYLAPKYYPNLRRIVLLDKDPHIDWTHIHEANQFCAQDGRPYLDLWAGTNLHERDALVTNLLSFRLPVAVTGIHLCKTLSPALVGLSNALGAPYLCVAPCCLPRPTQVISVAQYESPLQRNARLQAIRRATDARPRQRATRRCFVCGEDHHVKDCPDRHRYITNNGIDGAMEWNQVVKEALLLAQPCWNCGQTGHQRKDCRLSFAPVPASPSSQLNMTVALSSSSSSSSSSLSNPFQTYCQYLSTFVVQSHKSRKVQLVDAKLPSHHGSNHHWNQARKTIFIIATASVRIV